MGALDSRGGIGDFRRHTELEARRLLRRLAHAPKAALFGTLLLSACSDDSERPRAPSESNRTPDAATGAPGQDAAVPRDARAPDGRDAALDAGRMDAALLSDAGAHDPDAAAPVDSAPEPLDAAASDVDASLAPFVFTSRTARYADVLVTTEAVRLVPGPQLENMTQTERAEVDLQLRNLTDGALDLTTVQSWELVLASGERLSPLAPLGVELGPHASGTAASLAFVLPPGRGLAGSFLSLNDAAHATVALELHLDGSLQSPLAARVQSAIGIDSGAVNGSYRFLVLDAVLDVNDPGFNRRAPLAKRFLQLTFEGTALGEAQPPSRATLTVEGVSSDVVTAVDTNIPEGESLVYRASFVVPQHATQVVLDLYPRNGAASHTPIDLTDTQPCALSICEQAVDGGTGIPGDAATGPDAAR